MFNRRLHLETLEARTTLAVLLADGFASLAFNPENWDTATLANVAPTGTPTTTSLAARFNGNATGGDELRSVVLPAAGATSATLSYSFVRTGAGTRPTAGEDLVIELRTNSGDWTEIAHHVADDPDMQYLVKRTLTISLAAPAATLQLRIRHLGTRGQLGDYWIDDILLATGNSEISGRLWFDRNENATAEATEQVLAGWNVFADINRNGTREDGEPIASTDAEGRYTLANVAPGNHAVRPELPEGWRATGPQRGHVTFSDSLTTSDATALAGARAVVASGDGRFVYAAGSSVGALVVAERAADGALTVTQTLAESDAGGNALVSIESIVLSPDGNSFYAISSSGDAIATFDRNTATGQLAWRNTIQPADLGIAFDFPAAIAVSSDGKYVYVGASNSGSIVAFDRDALSGGLTYASSLSLGGPGLGGISALAFSPDGLNLYVTASGDRALVTLRRNVASGTLSHADTLFDNTAQANSLDGASAVAVSPDGRHVVVAGGFDDSLAVYARDLATGRLEFRDLFRASALGLSTLDGPQSLAFAADGSTLFVAAINGDAIHVLHRDAETGGLIPISAITGFTAGSAALDGVRSIAVLPDGGVVSVAQQASTLTSFIADAGQADIVLGSGEKLSSVDFGLSRDAARWQGSGTDAFWSTSTNWHGSIPPLDGEIVALHNSTTTPIASVNDLGETLTIAALRLSGASIELSGDRLRIAPAAPSTADTAAVQAIGGPHVVQNDLQFPLDASIQLGTGATGFVGTANFRGDITGTALTVRGDGQAQLDGEVTLSGVVNVESGTLQADGTFAVASVTVAEQATLAGRGLVASSIAIAEDAKLSPGAANPASTPSGSSSDASSTLSTSIANLSSGDLNLSADAVLVIDILGEEVVASHDALTVTGTVNIEGATIVFGLSGRLPIGVEYVLIANDGSDPIVGQFAEVSEGTYFELEGQRFRLSYTGGDGNDVTIFAPPTGEVFGRVWNDTNSNRVVDTGEGPLAAWAVFADVNGNGQLDPGEPTAISDINGDYHLDLVPVGRTKILPLLTNGWKATTPAPLTDFINHVETISTGASSQAPHLDGIRALATSPDGRHLYAVSNNDDALVTLRRDTYTGRLTYASELRDGVASVNGLNGARGLATSHDGKHVYAAGYFDDAVAAFARDEVSGELTFVEVKLDNTAGTDGLDGSSAVLVSPDDRHVYVAGYLDDAVAVFSRDASSGKLTYASRVRDGVAGANGLDGANALAISPDGKFVYVAGANDNAVAVFRRDAAAGGLTYVASLIDGQGGITTLGIARSIAVSPDGKFVFAAAELDNAVTIFRRDATTGLLTQAATARNGISGTTGLAGASAVIVSPDGERVYVASATDDAVVAFDLNRQTGALAYREHLASPTTPGLDGAAAIALSPNGDHVYIAGQNSDAIVMAQRTLPPDMVSLSPGQIVTNIDHGAINPPPQVVAIAARSSGWSTAFLSQFNTGSQLVAGLTLASDAVTYTAHGQIDQIAARFSETVAPTISDVVLFGVNQAIYQPTSFVYDAATFTAVWQLAQPVNVDKLLVSVSGNVRDASGAPMGSDVTRRLDILASSADGTTVQNTDLARVIGSLFSRFGSPEYAYANDINGDGRITFVDAILVRNLVGASLPTGEPSTTDLPPLLAHAPPPAIVVAVTPRSTPVAHAAPPAIVVAARAASAQAIVAVAHAAKRIEVDDEESSVSKRTSTRSAAVDCALVDSFKLNTDLRTSDPLRANTQALDRGLLLRFLR